MVDRVRDYSVMPKALLFCFGSRGDTQPHAALAYGLKKAGYECLALCNIDGCKLFDSVRIKSIGVHFDMSAYLSGDEKIMKVMADGNWIAFAETMGQALGAAQPKDFPAQWEAAKQFKPDVICSCALEFLSANAIAQVLRVPCLLCDVNSFSFLSVSKHNVTEVHEPDGFHKFCSMVMVAGLNIQFTVMGKPSLRE